MAIMLRRQQITGRLLESIGLLLALLPVLMGLGIMAVALPAMLLGVPQGLRDKAFRQRVSRLDVGQTESSVQGAMGQPNSIYRKTDLGETFPLEGVVWDGWKVAHEVLVYRGPGYSVAYVYLDAEGRVEHVALSRNVRAE
jgi:hypothetical protein